VNEQCGCPRFQGDNPGAKQSIWDKVGCSWEHVGEHIENMKNMLGTPGNLIGTRWEVGGNTSRTTKIMVTRCHLLSTWVHLLGTSWNIFYFLTVACWTCHKRQSNHRMSLLFCNIQGYVITTNCSKNLDTFQLVITPWAMHNNLQPLFH
jgi:hypothetical protein